MSSSNLAAFSHCPSSCNEEEYPNIQGGDARIKVTSRREDEGKKDNEARER